MILPQLTLGWPARPLWPNAKANWRAVAAARSRQKHDTGMLCLAAGLQRLDVPQGPVSVTLVFCGPSRRVFDLDGALSAMKGALDTIASTIRVDDRWFELDLRRGSPCKDGGVIVRMEAAADGAWTADNWHMMKGLGE